MIPFNMPDEEKTKEKGPVPGEAVLAARAATYLEQVAGDKTLGTFKDKDRVLAPGEVPSLLSHNTAAVKLFFHRSSLLHDNEFPSEFIDRDNTGLRIVGNVIAAINTYNKNVDVDSHVAQRVIQFVQEFPGVYGNLLRAIYKDTDTYERIFGQNRDTYDFATYAYRHVLDLAVIIYMSEKGMPLGSNADIQRSVLTLFAPPEIAQEINTRSHWTREFVRDEKSKELPPPNYQMKFCIELIAYNEMPVPNAEKEAKLPGMLENILIAAERYDAEKSKKNKNGAAEIEILINVNNQVGELYQDTKGVLHIGTRSNVYTLQLFKMINADTDIEQALAESEWIDQNNRAYFANLISRARSLRQKGMQFNAVNCTDGMYIATLDSTAIKPSANQGGRRLLLSEIALNRFSRTDPSKDKIHLFCDADLRVKPEYFLRIDKSFPNKKIVPRCIFYPMILEPDESDLLDTKESMVLAKVSEIYFGLRDFIKAIEYLADNNSRIPARYRQLDRLAYLLGFKGSDSLGDLPTLSVNSFVINDSGYKETRGWSINGIDEKGFGEDGELRKSINARREDIHIGRDTSAIAVTLFRIREASFMGKTSSLLLPRDEPQLTTYGKNIAREFSLSQSSVEEGNVWQFIEELYEKLMSLPMSPKERSLLNSLMERTSDSDTAQSPQISTYLRQVTVLTNLAYQLQIDRYSRYKYPHLYNFAVHIGENALKGRRDTQNEGAETLNIFSF